MHYFYVLRDTWLPIIRNRVTSLFVDTSQTYVRISAAVLVCSVVALTTYVSASGDDEHASAVESTRTEQLAVRTVGDTDPDNISAEGLASFYGEIISNDISSVHAAREGVLSAWHASVGESVAAGDVLGYVTVTGVSPEQQMLLAQQQANSIKAELDYETAVSISTSTEDVLRKNQEALSAITAQQRAFYTGTGPASTTYQTELSALIAKHALFTGKLHDFAQTTLVDVYSRISSGGTSLDSPNFASSAQIKNGISIYNSNLRNQYLTFLTVYRQKVASRVVTQEDVQEFLRQTMGILSNSTDADGFTRADLDTTIALVRDAQADFRDLSNTLAQVTIDKAAKERERGQLDIELAKSSTALETELRLRQLEVSSTATRAKNEARAAEILAQRLTTSAGGVVPILAPRAGIIASVDKNVGAYVQVSERIGYIATRAPERRVRFTVPPSWKEIKRGDTLTTVWRSEFAPSTATVTGVSPMISRAGGYQAEAVLPKDVIYPLGASVSLVPERSRAGAFVHRKAIVFEGTAPSMWTLDEHGELMKKSVRVGRQLGEYVEVTSELARGTRYVVVFDTSVQLKEGAPITNYMTAPAEEDHEEEGEDDGHGHDNE